MSTHLSDKENMQVLLLPLIDTLLRETAMTEARLSSSNRLRKQICAQDVLSIKTSL